MLNLILENWWLWCILFWAIGMWYVYLKRNVTRFPNYVRLQKITKITLWIVGVPMVFSVLVVGTFGAILIWIVFFS